MVVNGCVRIYNNEYDVVGIWRGCIVVGGGVVAFLYRQ